VTAVTVLLVATGFASIASLRAHSHATPRFGAADAGSAASPREVSRLLAAKGMPAATTPTGNVSLAAPLPNLLLPSGSVLEANYSVHVIKWPKLVTSIRLTVPSEQASFPTVGGGKLTLWIQGENFTINNTASYGGKSTLTGHTVGVGGAAFASGTHAALSSQLLALMETVRWGVAPVDLQWHWRVLAGSGAALANGSSPTIKIDPQGFVQIVSSGPSSLTPGQNFTVCVSGPLTANRTLSLHMEVPNPYRAFAWSTTHVPVNTTGSWCWAVQLPSSFTPIPSPLLVHVWSYASEPGILYILHTRAV